MAKTINMPKMGNTVESVIFSEWFVKEGDSVKKGDKLFSYETDKTTTEEEAKEDGVILKLLVEDNDEVVVFTPVAIIGKKGEDISKMLKEIESSKPKEIKPKEEPKPVAKVDMVPTPKGPVSKLEPKIKTGTGSGISPRALRAIQRSGIPLNSVTYGSGPRGRILRSDISSAKTRKNLNLEMSSDPMAIKLNEIVATSKQPSVSKEFKYSPMRSAIAKGMIVSQNQSAFTTLTIAIDAKELLKQRANFKKEIINGGHNISINDLIVFALSRLLPKYKDKINAHVYDDKGISHTNANIAIAVDTSNGLIVPVIKESNLKNLEEISSESKTIIANVRKGDYKNVDLKSGTFTISNVGAMNIEVFTPVLNDGQAAILGVGGLTMRPRKSTTGLLEFYDAMILSLTIDHRLADGADGARFLNDLKLILENIELIINN